VTGRFNPLDPLGIFSQGLERLPQSLSLPPAGVSGDFPFRDIFPEGAYLYHGTSKEDAEQILSAGFRPTGTYRAGSEPGTLWLAYNVTDALQFVKGPTPALLRVFLTAEQAEEGDCKVEVLSTRRETQVRVYCPTASRLRPLSMEYWQVGE